MMKSRTILITQLLMLVLFALPVVAAESVDNDQKVEAIFEEVFQEKLNLSLIHI